MCHRTICRSIHVSLSTLVLALLHLTGVTPVAANDTVEAQARWAPCSQPFFPVAEGASWIYREEHERTSRFGSSTETKKLTVRYRMAVDEVSDGVVSLRIEMLDSEGDPEASFSKPSDRELVLRCQDQMLMSAFDADFDVFPIVIGRDLQRTMLDTPRQEETTWSTLLGKYPATRLVVEQTSMCDGSSGCEDSREDWFVEGIGKVRSVHRNRHDYDTGNFSTWSEILQLEQFSVPPPEGVSPTLQAAAAKMKAGRAAEACSWFQAILESTPGDDRARSGRVACLLRMLDVETARSELARLEASRGGSDPLTERLTAVVETVEEAVAARRAFRESLESYDRAGAEALIPKMGLGEAEAVLEYWIALYSADFPAAEQAVEALSDIAQGADIDTGSMAEALTEARARHGEMSDELDRLLFGRMAASGACEYRGLVEESAELEEFTLEQYLGQVSQYVSRFPLAPHAPDLAFHAAILVGGEDHVREVGNRILDTRGFLRVPSYDEDGFFHLVVDRQNQRFRVEDIDHEFTTLTGKTRQKSYGRMKPFDVAFSEISELSQNTVGGAMNQGCLNKGGFYLQVGPKMRVPAYAFMHHIHNWFGEDTQQAKTRDLGRYLLEVVGREPAQVKLEDPDRNGGKGMMAVAVIGAAAAGAYSGMGGDTAMAQAQVTQLAQMISDRATDQFDKQQYGRDWRDSVNGLFVDFGVDGLLADLDSFVVTQ